MRHQTLFTSLFCLLLPALAPAQDAQDAQDAPLNIAHPDTHPYVDPAGQRDNRSHADEIVNEARVYDFYQRQADHYMGKESLPKILPAFPGLDAGIHGHWGLHNENNHEDGRWNDIDRGKVQGQSLTHEKTKMPKGIAALLGDDGHLAAAFDPEQLNVRTLWQDGLVSFDPFRWGTSRNASPAGPVLATDPGDAPAWTRKNKPLAGTYLGYYRHGPRIIFSYEIAGQPVLDSPWAAGNKNHPVFLRTLAFPEGFAGGKLRLGRFPANTTLSSHDGSQIMGLNIQDKENDVLSFAVPKMQPGQQIAIVIGLPDANVAPHAKSAADLPLEKLITGGKPQWPNPITVKGERTPDSSVSPYLVDTIPVPHDNPYQSVMQLSGIGFLPDGNALVSTLAGDVWTVSGLDDSLDSIQWKRFATGLSQPMGIHIDDDGIFILERGQLTRLHDLNNDGEADFYENYANDFDGRPNSHTHSFGLVRKDDGSFYFVNWKDICRTNPDRTTELFAFGVRNCMAVGPGAGDSVLVGPQEGTQTPTSMVIDVQQGEFYGHAGGDGPPALPISPPLCFVPRGIDNSTGGFVYVDSEKWGPLSGRTIGLSYGYSTHYLILRDTSNARPQGAIVPLEGDFLSGVVRGKFAPHDGQLYVVGLDGWGDYSVSDGCFQRVRYTGQPVHHPIGFQIHTNGIRVDFPVALDKKQSTKLGNFFAQQWNYEYANRYGSPEFSQREPDSLGHDPLTVRSVRLLDSGKSLFVEIPDIEPVMQLHLRMHLAAADGTRFKSDLFPTIANLGQPFDAPDLAPPVTGKPATLALRTDFSDKNNKKITESGELIEGERTIVLKCSAALLFDRKLLKASAGEALKLVFENPDIMPHNVVFVTEGNLKKVGDLSFSMLNDPKAGEKHYIPDVPEIFASTFLVQPGGRHTLHFRAPDTPGDHHFVCTFPGHWMTMNGTFRVSEK